LSSSEHGVPSGNKGSVEGLTTSGGGGWKAVQKVGHSKESTQKRKKRVEKGPWNGEQRAKPALNEGIRKACVSVEKKEKGQGKPARRPSEKETTKNVAKRNAKPKDLGGGRELGPGIGLTETGQSSKPERREGELDQ